MNAVLLLVIIALVGSPSLSNAQDCPTAPAQPEDRRVDKTTLTIATYNAEWLFIDGTNCPGSGCPWTTDQMAVDHLHKVAAELIIINADIVNLAEVQNCKVLTLLNDILTDNNMGYLPYMVLGTDTATGQNMGLLTRIDPAVSLERTANRVAYPLPSTQCSSTYTGTSAVSKHYFTHFNIVGLDRPLSIFGAHLLAFPDDPNRCVQREAQATVLAQLIAEEAIANKHSVVMLGDFNDFDPTITDAAKSVPISSVLNILKDPLKDLPTDDLHNVASWVASPTNVYSCWWNKNDDCDSTLDELSLIDHVLISQDLVKFVDRGWMDHSYGPMCNTLESDHWPVVVKLNISTISTPTPTPSFAICSTNCNSRGTCSAFESCTDCAAGWTGYDCNTYTCTCTGAGAQRSGSIVTGSACSSAGQCACTSGWSGLTCNIHEEGMKGIMVKVTVGVALLVSVAVVVIVVITTRKQAVPTKGGEDRSADFQPLIMKQS